ncbi:MAG: hypothetical protein LKF42_06795 [Streptococcaceae bacterium]|jgi:hypothetical protein|nr:hypothetical protein [Streptococcaceae bacterium]MCH4177786.1 hypothetical protein [Streptococcaceae bacterium]
MTKIKGKRVILWLFLLHIIIFFYGSQVVLASEDTRFELEVHEYHGIDKKAASVTIKNVSGENAENVIVDAVLPKSYNAKGKVTITVGDLAKDEVKSFLVEPNLSKDAAILPITGELIQSFKWLLLIIVLGVLVLSYYKHRKMRYLIIALVLVGIFSGSVLVKAVSGQYHDSVERTVRIAGVKYTFAFRIAGQFESVAELTSASSQLSGQSSAATHNGKEGATISEQAKKSAEVLANDSQANQSANPSNGGSTDFDSSADQTTDDKASAIYQIAHYKVESSGQVILADVETKSAKIGQKVKAKAKSYFGYQHEVNDQTTLLKSQLSGNVTADGKLVLKLYYLAIEVDVPKLVVSGPYDVVTLANAKWRVLCVLGNQALILKENPLTWAEIEEDGNQIAQVTFNQAATYFESGYSGSLVKASIDYYYNHFIKDDLAGAYVLPVELNLASERDYFASVDIISEPNSWHWHRWADYYGDTRFASVPQESGEKQAFALSMGDINSYLSVESAFTDLLQFETGQAFWLRSAGYNHQKAGIVHHGHFMISSQVNQSNALRPAMWVSVNS